MKHATSKLLMAAVLAIPVFARAQVVRVPGKATPTPNMGSRCGAPIGAMSAEEAKAAIAAAVEQADGNARRLAEIPVEYAPVTIGIPYGAEGDAICVKGENLAGYMESLHKKVDYWKAVRDALVKERARIKDEADGREQQRTAEEVVADGRASIKLYRNIRGSEALVVDAEKDIEMIKKVWSAAHDRENSYEVLARKTEVYRQLQALKTAQ